MIMQLKHYSSGKQKILPFTLFIITSLIITSCALPLSQTTQSDQSAKPSEIGTSQVEINFSLQLPAVPNQGERIAIEILDEVTGLPYNPRQTIMTKISQQQYAVTLSFTAGSIVKYRYVKLGSTIKSEAKLDGQGIRYRMFYALTTGALTDILQTWEGESRDIGTGTLSGRVTENEGGLPIPDLLISSGGQLTFTDANGKFFIDNLSPGVHNVVVYAIDGKYRTFQQGATISAGMNTPAEIVLHQLPVVTVTFNVSTPGDALGAPIYIAGNILQLGNTFSDLTGGMSINPKQMPQLIQKEDGSFKLSLQLFAETDLLYKFTLGDGYWNSEQQSSGGFRIRQLIVPYDNLELNLIVDSWRTPDLEPLTFSISIPPESAPYDEKYIQFKTSRWTEPIPLWPLGNSKYLFILFSPLDATLPIFYRYCRNDECQYAHNLFETSEQPQVQPSEVPQSITETITSWKNWSPIEQPTEIIQANIPWKGKDFLTGVELTPQMDSSWQVYAPIGISKLVDGGVNRVIFSPLWFLHPSSPFMMPEIGSTPFSYELSKLMNTTQLSGITTTLFPQLGATDEIESWWTSQYHDETWWHNWFDSYERFLLNYAKIAENTEASTLIIGGKFVLPAFSGGVYPDGKETDVPDTMAARWEDLLADIHEIYHGKLVWGVNVHTAADPLPSFIDSFDEIYVLVDSPLSQESSPSFEEISASFTAVIDSLIYEIYRSTLKPISVGLAYPSADGGAKGCALLSDNCFNDGLFMPEEISSATVDLSEQSLVYNAVIPVISSREWITGITIRGYEPTLVLHDASSSISGKPAWDIIQYWFSELNTE